MWPEAINRILHQLKMIRGGIFGLVGLQGVGKSSALQALYTALISEKYEKRHKTHKKSTVPREEPAIIFKWQQEEDLLKELLNTQDPICLDFFKRYSDKIIEIFESKSVSRHTTFGKSRHVGIGTFDQLEERLGKAGTHQLRHSTWLEFLKNKNAILIDTQDSARSTIPKGNGKQRC